MCYTPWYFWQHMSMAIFSGERYFNDILWAQAYNNNTLLLRAIRYKKPRAQLWKDKRKRSHFLTLPISNINNLCRQEAWNWGGIFKRTYDHIFEKISYIPYPATTPLTNVINKLDCLYTQPKPFSLSIVYCLINVQLNWKHVNST